jgi:hypothetical protein
MRTSVLLLLLAFGSCAAPGIALSIKPSDFAVLEVQLRG